MSELTPYQKSRAWDALLYALGDDDTMSNQFRLVMNDVAAQASLLVQPSSPDHSALVRQLVEALEYIECLDVNPSTYQDLGAVKRLSLASAQCRKALTVAKEHGYE